jgi:MYXO-CTERM domain-containing protein
MKTKQLAMTAALALSLITTALADTTTTNTFSANQTIPDADANGLVLNGTVSGLSGKIVNVNVTLDITNGFNGDLYAYLVGPNGGFAVLFNRVGVSNNASAFGYGNAGFDITLSDSSANDVHYYQNFGPSYNAAGQLTGTWGTDGINIDPGTNTPSAFLTAGQTAMLASMNGVDANGVWTLFLADMSSGGLATVNNWGLVITVPEPTTLALGAMGLGLLALHRKRSRK